LDKLKRDHEKTIGALTSDKDYAQKINKMTDEAKMLKDKIKKLEESS